MEKDKVTDDPDRCPDCGAILESYCGMDRCLNVHCDYVNDGT